jgi:hypothetical protein
VRTLLDEQRERRRHDQFAARSFAEAVDGRLVELRLELLREAQLWLSEYEQSREPVTQGRLLATLEHLALLVRA